eukprot:686836-Rhodomonas_salina.3
MTTLPLTASLAAPAQARAVLEFRRPPQLNTPGTRADVATGSNRDDPRLGGSGFKLSAPEPRDAAIPTWKCIMASEPATHGSRPAALTRNPATTTTTTSTPGTRGSSS